MEKLRTADRRDKNLRLLQNLIHIAGSGMAHGNRTVLREQKPCHGFSHNIASSCDHTSFPADRYSAALQKLNHAGRRTAHECLGISYSHPSHIHRMKSIHIFGRIYSQKNPIFVQTCRQRHLYQNPVDRRIRILLRNHAQKLFLCCILRHPDGLGLHADPAAGLCFIIYIDLGRQIFAYQNHCQLRSQKALFLISCDLTLELCAHFPGNLFAIYPFCFHI